MRTNPFYDAWLFLTGSTGEHAASGVGWLLTVLYLALLMASIAIAISKRRLWMGPNDHRRHAVSLSMTTLLRSGMTGNCHVPFCRREEGSDLLLLANPRSVGDSWATEANAHISNGPGHTPGLFCVGWAS